MGLVAPRAALWLARARLLVAAAALVGCQRAEMLARFTGNNIVAMGRTPDPAEHPETIVSDDARLAVLWIGHATVLIQMDDKLVLTDPVFTTTVGQLSKRQIEPGLTPAQLPSVDLVVISHLHFDHFSIGSLDQIEDKVPWLALPFGALGYLPRYDARVSELRRWQTHGLDGLRATSVPVEHNGWRYGLDRDWMTTSYTGWVIRYNGLTVYFGGDTAYDRDAFRRTRERVGHIDLALMPIAPVEPRWFMKKTHVDPNEALRAAFDDLRADHLVPIHFDTFINSYDERGDAERLLRAALTRRGASARATILAPGRRAVILRRNDARPP